MRNRPAGDNHHLRALAARMKRLPERAPRGGMRLRTASQLGNRFPRCRHGRGRRRRSTPLRRHHRGDHRIADSPFGEGDEAVHRGVEVRLRGLDHVDDHRLADARLRQPDDVGIGHRLLGARRKPSRRSRDECRQDNLPNAHPWPSASPRLLLATIASPGRGASEGPDTARWHPAAVFSRPSPLSNADSIRQCTLAEAAAGSAPWSPP